MFKLSHTTLILISGLIWLLIGCILLPLGLNFLVASILEENAHLSKPILNNLAAVVGSLDAAVLAVVILGLIVGYAKGKYVLGKSVRKGVERILTLSNPSSLGNIYTKKYYFLLGSMVLLGFIVRFFPLDVRGAVDVTIGAALITGALLYFQSALNVYRGVLVAQEDK